MGTGCDWATSRPGRSTDAKKIGTNWIWGWVSLIVGIDALENRICHTDITHSKSQASVATCIRIFDVLRRDTCKGSNSLTPNDHYSGRTAPLTSKPWILYIYSTNIGTEYFKHGILSSFFLFKMQFVSQSWRIWYLYYSHFIYRVC
jgi:hypothetical protein